MQFPDSKLQTVLIYDLILSQEKRLLTSCMNPVMPSAAIYLYIEMLCLDGAATSDLPMLMTQLS